jgi:hypothetical protein
MLAAPIFGTHAFEGALRWILGGIGVVAVGWGVLNHRDFRVVLPLGAAVLFLGLSSHESAHGTSEVWLSLLASACLIGAHLMNTAACRARASY